MNMIDIGSLDINSSVIFGLHGFKEGKLVEFNTPGADLLVVGNVPEHKSSGYNVITQQFTFFYDCMSGRVYKINHAFRLLEEVKFLEFGELCKKRLKMSKSDRVEYGSIFRGIWEQEAVQDFLALYGIKVVPIGDHKFE